MSRPLARLFLLFSIAIALPAQGTAAVSAGLCMALGHHEAPAVTANDHAADHAGSAHASHGSDRMPAGQCGPCVACCAAASISASTEVLLASPRHGAADALHLAEPPGGLPDGLDHPPQELPD